MQRVRRSFRKPPLLPKVARSPARRPMSLLLEEIKNLLLLLINRAPIWPLELEKHELHRTTYVSARRKAYPPSKTAMLFVAFSVPVVICSSDRPWCPAADDRMMPMWVETVSPPVPPKQNLQVSSKQNIPHLLIYRKDNPSGYKLGVSTSYRLQTKVQICNEHVVNGSAHLPNHATFCYGKMQ